MVLVTVTRLRRPCARRSRSLAYAWIQVAPSFPRNSGVYPSGLPVDLLMTAFAYGMTYGRWNVSCSRVEFGCSWRRARCPHRWG